MAFCFGDLPNPAGRMLLAASLAATVAGCGDDREVLTRQPNPTKQIDAIQVVDNGGGATVASSNMVYVAPHDAKLPKDAVFSADRASHVTVVWTGPFELQISASKANVYVKRDRVPTPLGDVRVVYRIPFPNLDP